MRAVRILTCLLITGVTENDTASLEDTWAVSHKTLQNRCCSLLELGGGGVSVNVPGSYVWRAEDNLGCHSLGTSCLLFGNGISHGDLGSLPGLGGLASELQRSSNRCFPSTGITSVCHHTWLLYMDSSELTKDFMLAQQAQHLLIHLPNFPFPLFWFWHCLSV